MTRVITGAERVAGDPSLLGHGRFGLVTNFTGVMPDLSRNVDALLAAGLNITALFGPEHGLRGTVQAGKTEAAELDASTGLPIFETYLATDDELDALVVASGVDALVFDMQDIGVRFYTYLWTMYDCMRSAARTGIRFIVLDRPNPLGGATVEGPGVDEGFGSFVGRADIPIRHGLTAGELARYVNDRVLRETEGGPADLSVVRMGGWTRRMLFDETELEWVAPSPNMPTLDTAFAFAGTGLLEGTNVSEGRGTTRPFEVIGAPYIDSALIGELRSSDLPGVLFREVWYVPTFHKYAGETLRGVQLHVTDRRTYEPVRCGVSVLAAIARLYPHDFRFLAPGEGTDALDGGFAVDRLWGIDRLWGSDRLRVTVASGGDPLTLVRPAADPGAADTDAALLYR
jgi:uncharacterized protein YbbC (DUF1343 family)